MPGTRITQLPVEVVRFDANPASQISQMSVESLTGPTANNNANVSQIVIEVLTTISTGPTGLGFINNPVGT